MAFPEAGLKLRSDVDKGLTAPSAELRLRSTQDKEYIPKPVVIGTNS